MPQDSIAYAVGRVRATARKPLGQAQIDRLLAASSYEEALRILQEMGWAEADGQSVEQISLKMMESACQKLREISPDVQASDAFLLRHDAQNLKALLKARVLGVKPEGLSHCGTIPVDLLAHAVNEHSYKKLPPAFEIAMEALEKSIALQPDPMLIDLHLDKALYTMLVQRMKKVKSKDIKAYFAAKADFQNAQAFLRLKTMDNPRLKLADFLLPGGKLAPAVFEQAWDKPERLEAHYKPYGKAVQAALLRAIRDYKAIPALEKAGEDFLLDLFRPQRYEPYAIEVLVGWLLAHERETAAVRLILAGKLNGFGQDIIRERLREAYGQ